MEVSAQVSSSEQRIWPDPDAAFQVRLRLYSERLLVEQRDGKFKEQATAVVSLHFDYGGVLLRPRRSDDWLEEDADDGVERDDAAERRAQALLERFGAVELDCVDGLVSSYASNADYVINVDENVHAICSFSGPAVEELRALGWHVQTDDDFQFQVVPGGPWVAELSDRGDTGNWFQLELGVEIDGTRVDLVDRPKLPGLGDSSNLSASFPITFDDDASTSAEDLGGDVVGG
ncbi:MAG TPA: hypothetical protein PKD61_11945, partial [Polyangiaceae bacterium]|nr:hypothetical protein [Polyangiaceae bacterium]